MSFLNLVDFRLRIAPQDDVSAATRHVGGNGDHFRPAGLRDDFRFARVLLGIKHLMRKFFLVEHRRQQLGILDRGRADQNRLSALVAVADIVDHRLIFLLGGAVHLVHPVLAHHFHVRGHDDGFQSVDLLKFVGLCIRGACHAGKLLVHPEIILIGNRGQRLIFALNANPFLGFHRPDATLPTSAVPGVRRPVNSSTMMISSF